MVSWLLSAKIEIYLDQVNTWLIFCHLIPYYSRTTPGKTASCIIELDENIMFHLIHMLQHYLFGHLENTSWPHAIKYQISLTGSL